MPLPIALWTSAALLALAVTAPANAEPAEKVRLVYSDRSRANCPTEASLKAAAARRLGFDPFGSEGPVTLHATITRAAHGLRGEIKLEDPGRASAGARVIHSNARDCTELGKAMALTMSIAIDALQLAPPADTAADPPPAAPAERPPKAADATEPSAPSTPSSDRGASGPKRAPRAARRSAPSGTEPDAAPAAEGDDADAEPVEDDETSRAASAGAERARWEMAVSGLAAAGLTPGVTAGAGVGIGWVGSRGSIALEGRTDLPRAVAYGPGEIAISPIVASLIVCTRWSSWSLCGLGRIGTLRGTGRGFAVDTSGAGLLATLGARLAWEIAGAEPVRFRIFADLESPLTQNTFDVDRRPAWAIWTLAGTLGGAAAVRFP